MTSFVIQSNKESIEQLSLDDMRCLREKQNKKDNRNEINWPPKNDEVLFELSGEGNSGRHSIATEAAVNQSRLGNNGVNLIANLPTPKRGW